MTLQKQTIGINLTGGLDTKSDEKAMIPGKLTDLENVEILKTNKLQKRDGYTALPAIDEDGNALTGGTGLATFNDELLRIKDGELYSLSETADRWVSRGELAPCVIETEAISRSLTGPEVHMAMIGNYVCYTHIRKAAIFDLETKVDIAVIEEPVGIATTALGLSINVKCVALGTKFYVFGFAWGSGANRRIICHTFDTGSVADGFSAATDPLYTANGRWFDVVADEDNSRIWLAYQDDDDQTVVTWVELDEDLTEINSDDIALGATMDVAQINIVRQGTTNFYVFFYDTTANNYVYFVQTSGGTTAKAPTTVMAGGSEGGAITGVDNGTGVTFFADYADATDDERVLRSGVVDTTGVTTAAADLVRGLSPITMPFEYDSVTYIGCMFPSEEDSTIVWIRGSDGVVIARSLPGEVFGYSGTAIDVYSADNNGNTGQRLIRDVLSPSSGIFYYGALSHKDAVGLGLGSVSGRDLAVNLCKLDFVTGDTSVPVQLNGSLVFPGAVVKSYDGLSVSEAGFHVRPKISGNGTTPTTGGNLSAGVYQYVAVYEWFDRNGVRHRSAPSDPLSVDLSASGTSTNVVNDIAVRTYRFTEKSEPVYICLYRTEADGSTFYLLTLTNNDTTADEVEFDDSSADSTIISREVLYTTGGVLPVDPPPAAKYIAAFKNRLFLAGLEREGGVYYSQENGPGLPIEFSLDLTLPVENNGKRQTGVKALGDKLLVAKEDKFFYTYGDGPSDTGLGGTFAPFQPLEGGLGVKDPASLVQTPLGLMFKSLKGFYLLDHGFGTHYIGEGVEAHNAETVTSAVVALGKNRVRFTTEGGDLLEYDTYYQQWFTQTGLDAYSAVMWGSTYVILRNTGADVLYETSGTYTDASTDYLMKIETGWISLAGIVNYQRVYRLFVLGERKASHSFKVSVAYDYSGTYEDTVTLEPDTALDDGASGFYPFRMAVHLKKQKCEAIRIKIEEVSPAGTKQSFTITALGLQFGAKNGLPKIRAAQKKGTS